MRRNDSGRGTGLALALVLIVALAVAWLAITQMGSLRKSGDSAAKSTDLVQQAQDAVDSLKEIPHNWVVVWRGEFLSAVGCKFRRLTGGKSRNLQAADG